MENAADALIMAVDMLIFILALTLCISSFSNVRQGVDNIINRPETIKMAKDSDVYINFIQSNKYKATRVVGVETVVPTLYRAVKENYVVYIKFNHNISSFVGLEETIATKNFEIENEDGSKNILNGIIYKFKAGNNPLEKNNSAINKLLQNGLYNELEDCKFYEYLGEFKYDTATNVEDRTTYRIITYIQKTT